jgi:hypothetical protein
MVMIRVVLVGLILLVQFAVINPMMKPLANGNYGELYGPVSLLRWPFYIVMTGLVVMTFCSRRGET